MAGGIHFTYIARRRCALVTLAAVLSTLAAVSPLKSPIPAFAASDHSTAVLADSPSAYYQLAETSGWGKAF
jgi:hypothetical protein